MEPAEVWEMYDGMMWRHSRQVELVATHAFLVRSMLSGEEKYDAILGMFPYYQREEKP